MKAIRLAFLSLLVSVSFAQSPAKKPANIAEQRTARHFESIKNDPLALRNFLYSMPKGGDLHNHMSGAVYAESYVRWAAEDGICVETATLNIVRPKTSPIDVEKDAKPACDQGKERPATEALTDPALYAAMIDAMSMRQWDIARKPGQYQFFDAFNRFSVGPARLGHAIAESRRRAAAQHVHYLELMVQMDERRALLEAPKKLQWKEDLSSGRPGKPDFAGMHHQLDANGLFIEKRSALLDKAEATMNAELGCGTAKPDKACAMPLRYQCQVLRAFPKESVFAQIAFCFELAQSDPRVVTLNLVQPEDWYVPVRDFDLHMKMIEYFHGKFPKMKITLHAGELAFGQVPPEVLGQHIPKSIDTGHANRIGHGTDVMHYPHPADLMAEMVAKNVAVEIAPSSSKFILGIEGKRHPLRHYLKAGVAVVIATDDEGVARSDITNEYQQAVEQHGLSYAELKKISLDSLEYGFLAGDSLRSCDAKTPKPLPHAASCDTITKTSEKAAAQWKLRQAFAAFEKNH
jgi:adenosine deaminase